MAAHTHDVVITGVGLACCLGSDAETAWQAVVGGRCGMGPLTLLEGGDGAGRLGGQAADPPAKLLDGEVREVRLLRQAIDEATRRSALGTGGKWAYPPHRCAVVLGTTLHGMRRAGEHFRSGDPAPLGQFLAAPVLARAVAGLPVAGPGLTTCSACSSGLGSIALGITLLKTGHADAVLAGGYDPVSEYAYAGFDSLRLIAEESLRPFCVGRDGMKLGEAYAIVVLERASDAARRGAPALAAVKGFGESADAHHLTQPHPQGEGATRAVRDALDMAGITAEQIGLIAAHATGTPNNDAAEYGAYTTVFGAGLPRIPVVAFKSHLGHCLGGAGAAELILSAMALRDQTAPPTANVEADQVEFPSLNITGGAPRPARISCTLNTSLGFGGANTCVVLGRAGAPADPPMRAQSGLTTARDVLITGVGVVLPGLVGNDALAARLRDRPDAPVRADTGSIPEEQILPLLSARRVRRVSDYSKFTLAAAALAFRDAGITEVPAFTEHCSALLGTMIGSTAYSEAYYSQIVKEGMAAANPMLFAEGVPNAASAQLSMMLGIRGACQTIIGSRTSGLDALGLAFLRIRAGLWQRAVVGAGEEFSPLVNRALRSCGLYAGTDAGLPFADERGFATGAGAVVLVLESSESALARGGRARGRVLGYGASLGGDRAGRTSPRAFEFAFDQAGSAPAIVSSACGSWLDGSESTALSRNARTQGRLVVSSMYGHIAETLSVGPLAGVAGLLLTGRLPRLLSPTAGLPPGLVAATGEEAPGEALVMGTDVAGSCSVVRLGVG